MFDSFKVIFFLLFFFYSGKMKRVHFFVCIHMHASSSQHHVKLQVCEGGPTALTFKHHCLWPTAPTRPGLAFHYELLDWMEALLLESQVAAKDFSTALVAHLSFLYQKKVGVIQLQDMYIIFVKVHTELGYVCYDCMHC